MKLPKLVRKLWLPIIAILILGLIATIELREPFVTAAGKTEAKCNATNCAKNGGVWDSGHCYLPCHSGYTATGKTNVCTSTDGKATKRARGDARCSS